MNTKTADMKLPQFLVPHIIHGPHINGLKLSAAAQFERRIYPRFTSHTHAAMLSGLGFKILDVSKRMGHSNTRVTQEVYEYLFRDLDNSISDTFGKLFRRNSKNVAEMMLTKNRRLKPSVFQCFAGEGDGNRTHVRKHIHRSVSERSLYFKFRFRHRLQAGYIISYPVVPRAAGHSHEVFLYILCR